MDRPSARKLAVLVVTFELAACQQAATPQAAPGSAAPSEAASDLPAPPPPAAQARAVDEKTDLYAFSYSYPAAAAAIPPLRDGLEADIARTRAELASEAREASKDAKADGYPFNPYEGSTEWQVVTDLPGWLSLSAQVYSFTGGAHGNTAFDAMLWDKAAGKRRSAMELFASPGALKAAITKSFCAELDRQRAKRRQGDEVWDDPADPFVACIDPAEQVVILGSKGGKGFDRIGFLIAPYNAGPYAEGTYEVTLPVTAALLAAVKPEYKAAFVIP